MRTKRLWPLVVILIFALLAMFSPGVLTLHRHVRAAESDYTNYQYISTATTTFVPATFLAIVTENGGTAGIVTLYDINQAGCTGTPASGKFATVEAQGTLNPLSLFYYLRLKNGGLCVVTAMATDLTVSYQ